MFDKTHDELSTEKLSHGVRANVGVYMVVVFLPDFPHSHTWKLMRSFSEVDANAEAQE